jgi:hypothetical protein
MAADDHFVTGNYLGIYYKFESRVYRKTCEGCENKRGYHSNRWDAHHILPGVSFSNIPTSDTFAHDCLKLTDFNINETYAMGGLPKLTAFILWYQDQAGVEYDESKEMTVTMRRWKTVKQYQNQLHMTVEFPGDFPVHNPVSFGHFDYNKEVTDYLNKDIFQKLKASEAHPKPREIKQMLIDAKDAFWEQLEDLGKGVGGGGLKGIDKNFRNRYGKAKNGWWKPMCMSKAVKSAPASPGIK